MSYVVILSVLVLLNLVYLPFVLSFHDSHLCTITSPLPYRINRLYLNGNRISSPLSDTKLYISADKSNEALTPAQELRKKLRGTNVFFVGMMGSGKSTVGKEFARILDYRFVDTDELAEFMIEMPIAQFFEQGKVDEFRQVEHQVLLEMSQYTRLAVATGGGIVEKYENWGLLRHGLVVFLDMQPADIFARLVNADPSQIQKRPLLVGLDPLQKLQDIYAKRQDKYEQADIKVIVKPDASPSMVAEQAIHDILTFIINNPSKQECKIRQNSFAVKAAARMNPAATAAVGVGFGDGPRGTIQHVSVQDLVSMPSKANSVDSSNSSTSHGKGFKPSNPPS